jgi:methylmalonyl-CoA/ethylmalonyl-CoA epimerase
MISLERRRNSPLASVAVTDHDALPSEIADLVERFDHVSIAVPDIAEALPLVEMLGGRFRSGGIARGGFRWAQWHLPGAGKLEVVAPVDTDDPSHFLVRFLARRGPGLHHVTFKVRDIHAAIQRAEEAGFEVVDVDTSDPGWKEAFLHPKSASGVLVQIAEWTDREGDPNVTIEDVLGRSG